MKLRRGHLPKRFLLFSAPTVLCLLLGLIGFEFGRGIQSNDVVFLGVFHWKKSGDARHGGFSGLELSDDGKEFVALSDNPALFKGRFRRHDGKIVDVSSGSAERLVSDLGKYIDELNGDAEALAGQLDGDLFLSLEGYHAINEVVQKTPEVAWIEPDSRFRQMPANQGIEALAIDRQGRILAIPETWSAETIPIFRLDAFQTSLDAQENDKSVEGWSNWSTPFELRKSKGFKPVGADVGPDNKLYILERRFMWGVGFASQVRRFEMQADGLRDETVLFRSRLRRFDNLEGISVWRDPGGSIRLTMISDDNFRWFQRTEFVEYKVD